MTKIMINKLKKFAQQLRERGYSVEFGHVENETHEIYSLVIEKDKTKKYDYYG